MNVVFRQSLKDGGFVTLHTSDLVKTVQTLSIYFAHFIQLSLKNTVNWYRFAYLQNLFQLHPSYNSQRSIWSFYSITVRVLISMLIHHSSRKFFGILDRRSNTDIEALMLWFWCIDCVPIPSYVDPVSIIFRFFGIVRGRITGIDTGRTHFAFNPGFSIPTSTSWLKVIIMFFLAYK